MTASQGYERSEFIHCFFFLGMILTLKETGVPKCVLSGPPQLVSLKAEPSILTSTGISSFAHQPSALQRNLRAVETLCVSS